MGQAINLDDFYRCDRNRKEATILVDKFNKIIGISFASAIIIILYNLFPYNPVY